jgi:hypothetical protein
MPRIRGAVFVLPFVPLFSLLTARYIARHRERLLPASQAISARDQEDLSGFFSSSLLAETRIVCASVPNPKFYGLVKMLGIEGVLEMSSIGAITLVDLIAYPDRMHRGTLFHELVHAVQYQVLGLPRFADLYVRGFLNHGGYDGIPLERQAYELEERFSRNPKRVFSVEEDVVHRLNSGLL